MVVYCIAISFFYLLSISKIKNVKLTFWCLMGLLALISALRYEVGTDYNNFVNVLESFLKGKGVYTEFGYDVYMGMISRFFRGSIVVLYAGEAFFTIFAFGYFIQKNVKRKYWIYSGALFITSTIFFATMNVTRQYVAIGFLLFAYEYLKKKQYLVCTLFSVLAVSFHGSAVIVVIFFVALTWLDSDENRLVAIMKYVNIAVIVSLFLIFIDIRYIFVFLSGWLYRVSFLSRFTGYYLSDHFSQVNPISFVKFIVPNIFWFYLYYHRKKIREFNPYSYQYMLMFAFYLLINNCFSGINIFTRLGFYFEYSLLCLIPLAVDMNKSKSQRFAMKVFFLFYYLALTIYSIFIVGGHGVMPYQSILG